MKLCELRLSTRITTCALIIVVAGAASLAFVENARIRDAYLSDLRAHLKNDLDAEQSRLNQAIDTLRQDVLFLANTPPVSGVVRAALNHGYDPRYGNTHKVWAERLEQIFSAFSQAHPNYFQIRYIGVADGGREFVRIGNRGGEIEATPPDQLQTKADRGYFKATLGLHKGQVYLSELDLTQEERAPGKPTLRASTPVFTPSGKIFGMVVINLDVSGWLSSAERSLPSGVQTYIADTTGQYLLHPDSQKVFTYKTERSNEVTADFPFAETMFNTQTPAYLPLQAVTTSAGSAWLCAKRVHFDPGTQSRFLLLLHAIPAGIVEKQLSTIPAQNIAGGLIVMLLVSGIATLVLRRTFAPLEQIASAADRITSGQHDIMLPQNGGGEIGSLAKALNTMLTQLLHRELALQESESRYRRLYESMMDAFVMVDMTGRLLSYNRPFQKMLGFSADELHRLPFADRTPEKWRELESRIVDEQIIPHGYSQVYEKEYIRKDGTAFPVELKTFLLRDESNRPEAMCAIVRDITERKHAEDTLRLHSEILKNLVEGVFLIRASDGVIVFANPQFERMFGYSSGELLGKHVSAVNAPGEPNPDAVANAIIAELTKKGVWSGEVRNIRKGGAVFWSYVNASSFEHPQFGQVWVSVHEDITGRKHAEDELRKFFDLIPDMACIASTDGSLLKINPAWQVALGYTEQELLFAPFFDLIHPDDRHAAKKEVERQIGGDANRHFVSRYRRKDGGYRWLEWQITPAVSNTLLYATARDITERKQVEEQLQKSAEEIEDLYNHAPCGYHSLDQEGIIRQVNDTELAWLGYTRNELIGKMKWSDMLTISSQQVFRKDFQRFKEQGFARGVEVEIVRKDGSTFTSLINSLAVYDNGGQYVTSRSTVTDITERKQIDRQMQQLSAHLQTIREEEKARIARELHDELGGTLTALKIEAYRLASELSANKAATQALKRVGSMSNLLDDAVGVARRIITDLRPTLLDDLGLLAALEWQAEQFQKRTGISCRVNCVEDKGTLDKQKTIALFRIFQETLSNVARHSGASRVEVEYQCDDEEVSLSSSDNGCGLPVGHSIAPTSYGMRGMSERAVQLGGGIKFGRPPGGGFSVTVILPVHDKCKPEETS